MEDHQENLLGVGLALGGLFLMGALYIWGPVWLDRYLVGQLDTETTGVVLAIEQKKVMREDRLGGQVTLGGFVLTYQYKVEGHTYKKEEYLARRSVSKASVQFLLRATPGDSITIRYDASEPSRARWLRRR